MLNFLFLSPVGESCCIFQECSSIISAISNEETSFASEILERGSFVPRKGSDGEDVNGHICHIDSPETDTYPTSDVVQGESLMDDISSMVGEMLYGYDQDSVADTYTDDTTLFHTELGNFPPDNIIEFIWDIHMFNGCPIAKLVHV